MSETTNILFLPKYRNKHSAHKCSILQQIVVFEIFFRVFNNFSVKIKIVNLIQALKYSQI